MYNKWVQKHSKITILHVGAKTAAWKAVKDIIHQEKQTSQAVFKEAFWKTFFVMWWEQKYKVYIFSMHVSYVIE